MIHWLKWHTSSDADLTDPTYSTRWGDLLSQHSSRWSIREAPFIPKIRSLLERQQRHVSTVPKRDTWLTLVHGSGRGRAHLLQRSRSRVGRGGFGGYQMRTMILAALAATMLCGTGYAATPIVSGGMLTGATGVTVGSLGIYDVGFFETCAGAFGTCSASNFDFHNGSDATVAAQALLDQVFLDTSAGQFDSMPNLTAGCPRDFCNALVPYSAINPPVFQYNAASNGTAEIVDYVVYGNGSPSGTDNSIFSTYAHFTRTGDVVVAGPVPEPATWAMMILGFGMLGATMRRRKVAVTFA